jgi:hypothetical protein
MAMESDERRRSSSAAESKRSGEVDVASHAHEIKGEHTAHGEVWKVDRSEPEGTPSWYQPESGQPGPRDPDEAVASIRSDRDDRR